MSSALIAAHSLTAHLQPQSLPGEPQTGQGDTEQAVLVPATKAGSRRWAVGRDGQESGSLVVGAGGGTQVLLGPNGREAA